MPGPAGGGRHGGGGSFGGGARGGFSGGTYGGVYGNRRIGGIPTPSPYNIITGKRGGAGIGKKGAIGIVAVISVLLVIGCVAVVGFFSKHDASEPAEDQLLAIESVERTKLSTLLCDPINRWLEDEAGLLRSIDEKTQVEAALAYFYKKTGVQPYLLMLDEIDGNKKPDWDAVENYLTERYIELFGEDEGHYIFLYLAHKDTSYTLYYIPGLDAMTVVDDEVSQILMDCVELYYRQSSSYGEMFAKAFVRTAELIVYPQRQDASVQFTNPHTVLDIYGFTKDGTD